jgi:kinetochore protein Spc7/SPC105
MTTQQSPVKSPQSPERVQTPATPTAQTEEEVVKESPANQRDLHQKKRRRRSSGLAEPMLDDTDESVYSSSPSGDIASNSSPLRVEEGIESSDESDTDGDTAMSMDEATVHSMNSEESASSSHSSLEDRLRRAADQAGTRGIDHDEHGDDLPMEMATGTVTNAFQPWALNRAAEVDNSAIYDQENAYPILPSLQAEDGGDVEIEDDGEEQSHEMSMDVTNAVGGIVTGQSPEQGAGKSRRKSGIRRRRSSVNESVMDETMEFTVMQGGIIGAGADNTTNSRASDEDISMEFTHAAGGLLNATRRESMLSEMADENDAMDMTAAVGVILAPIEEQTEPQTDVEDQTMAMDTTRAVGGILFGNQRLKRQSLSHQTQNFPEADVDEEQTTTMDITRAMGGILPGKIRARPTYEDESTASPQAMPEAQDEGEDQTMAMDITRAVGGILPGNKRTTDVPPWNESSTSPQPPLAEQTTLRSTPYQHHRASIASETGSPSLALKPRPSARSQRSATKPSTTPQAKVHETTPVKSTARTKLGTPSKQITPLPSKPESPNKTPLSANVVHRGASPKKLFKAEIKARASPASTKRNRLFSPGSQTPSIVLKATRPSFTRRRPSGVGIDQNGIGSPRVTELLDRRSSIGDAAPQFKLVSIEPDRLRSENPQQLAQEVEAERAEELRRESGRFIMEQEADEAQEENTTATLKDMIESMTPQKPKGNKIKGRKSLAVGAAKGLLGKRPVELDIDDDEEADSTPKRLRIVSRESSPVKQIRLPKPPSKDETTGRLGARLQKSLQDMASSDNITPTIRVSSPSKNTVPQSPAHTGRFRDAEAIAEARPESFEDKLDNVIGAIDISTAQMDVESAKIQEEKISLQQFLNMTNIHFIELSTTKRRHTMAHSMPARPSQEGMGGSSTEASFVAAATTLPLLELYQHATRELKSYISTGRKIIRSIEAETLAEQPALFREYLDARPDMKVIMDNQFRNGKAHARLQSKEGWYQWRAQLVDGLKAGLQGIDGGMKADLELLEQQQQTLSDVLPLLHQERADLESQKSSLEQSLKELDTVDHEVLNDCRRQLQNADEYFLQRSALLDSLQEQMREKEDALQAADELKTEMKEQIAEADRVREEHKGWPVADVLALKSRVEVIEKQTGWRLVSAEEEVDEPTDLGAALVMTYKDELRLFFYPQAFQCKVTDAPRRRSGRRSASTSGPTAPISLTYAPTNVEDPDAPVPELPTEKRFFLQLIRSQLHAFAMMPKRSIASKTVLATVSDGWSLACKISEELRLLNLIGISTATILSDEKLGLKVMLMTPRQGRIDIEFAVSVTILSDGNIVASTTVTAAAMYGSAVGLISGSKGRKVQHALTKEVESRTLGEGAFFQAVQGFEEWLYEQEKAKQEAKKEAITPVPAIAPVDVAPQSSSVSATPARNPLAPKRTNAIQKKALPMPKQRLEKLSQQSSQPSQHTLSLSKSQSQAEKENFNPTVSVLGKLNSQQDNNGVASGGDWEDMVTKAAMPPDVQEQLYQTHTPIKRVGALRRSPI